MATRKHIILACVDCDDDLKHCHGTALVLSDGSHVCSDDPDCRMDVELHVFASLDQH